MTSIKQEFIVEAKENSGYKPSFSFTPSSYYVRRKTTEHLILCTQSLCLIATYVSYYRGKGPCSIWIIIQQASL